MEGTIRAPGFSYRKRCQSFPESVSRASPGMACTATNLGKRSRAGSRQTHARHCLPGAPTRLRVVSPTMPPRRRCHEAR